MGNKLFNIVTDPNNPENAMVEPTEYLEKLEPHEAIGELRAYVEQVAEDLEKSTHADLSVPANLEKVQKLAAELETSQLYLTQVFDSWRKTQVLR